MKYLVAAAVLPALALLLYIRKLDKVEAEPTGMIMKLCGFGALTVISAVILEVLGGAILGAFLPEDSLLYIALENYLIVAGAEEAGKLFALKKGTWKSPEFNYTYDAVVYAVAASLGFAAVENVMYVLDGGFGLAVLRALTSLPGHAIFGVFMGLFYGAAKKDEMRRNESGKRFHMAAALLVPMLLHGFYDFCLSVSSGWMLLLFFVFFIILMIISFFLVRKLAQKDEPVVQLFAQPANPAVSPANFRTAPVNPAAQPVYPQTPPVNPVQPVYPQTPPVNPHAQPVYPQTPPVNPAQPVYPQTPPNNYPMQ